ncbi:MAG: Rab family GTPase [Candidatus Hermodarchaeia archaeon]
MQPNLIGWVSSGDGSHARKAVLKLIVVGDGGVGKTTLIHRYLTGSYLDQRMTVGSGFATRDIEMEGIVITLAIWDFAGEERFRFLMPSYCRGALGCILAFDLTRPPTFYHLDEWLTLVRENTDDIPILLVATKRDVAKYPVDEGLRYAQTNGLAGFIETSSKEGYNVAEVFNTITSLMWNRLLTADAQQVSSLAV